MKSNDSPDELEPRKWARPVASRKLVVIAASAGGLHALTQVLASLPADFPAAIAVVQHRSAQHPELLPELLNQRTALKVRHARDGDLLEPGTVYICPPEMHMMAEHCVRLVTGERLKFVRPSADLIFGSVAHAYGDQAIGVVLSGMGSDGAAGSLVISDAGGTVVAQEPKSCAYRGMPVAAIKSGAVDLVLPLERIGEALQRMVHDGPPVEGGPVSVVLRPVTRVLLADDHRIILDGLRTLLGREKDMEVVAEAENGHAAVRLAAELLPDVVVMDIAMPDLGGVEATRQIKARNPQTSVVALSAHTDTRTASQMLSAGATGYLCKNDAFADLAVAIRSVAVRRPYFSARLGDLVIDGNSPPNKALEQT